MQQSPVAMEGRSTIKKVTDEDIIKVLGVPRLLERDRGCGSNDVAGVVTD
jgi:hypothetical protein